MDRTRRQDDPLAGFTEVTTLASSATATVHRARDVVSGQLVAVKLLEGPDAGGWDRAAFERVVRPLGAVSPHPNVVTLHRAELAPDGRPLLVLELCDGSLADRLATDGPLPVRTVVSAGVAVAGALETAHRAGIVHGGVTPRNLLVTPYGAIVLADVGVAALLRAGADGRTRDPSGSPSLAHVAPEVVQGFPATPPSDVYSLASAMFELMAGHPPGPADPGSTGPRLRRPGAPAALPALLARALAEAPGDRPSTALEFAQHLRAIEQATGWPATACRVGDPDGSWVSPIDAVPTSRRGRAAAMTGLPPLQLGAPPLDPGFVDRRREPRPRARRPDPRTEPWKAPDPAGARTHLAPPADPPDTVRRAGSAPATDPPAPPQRDDADHDAAPRDVDQR